MIHTLTDTVTLDSKDRESYSASSTDFEIKLPFSNRPTNFIHIKEIGIPLLMDNVITGRNDTFELDDVVQTINEGQYTIGYLMDYLTEYIINYTFEYIDWGRVRITNDSSETFKFEPGTALKLLGFTQSEYTGSDFYVGEIHPNLLPTKYFTLHSKFIATRQKHNHYHSDRRSDMIAIIKFNHGLGEMLWWSHEEPLFKNINYSNNDLIDFQLRDDNNVIVDIGNESIVLELDRITK